MKIRLYLPVIIVFSTFYFILDKGVGNMHLFKNILIVSFLTACLYANCSRIPVKTAKATLTEGLDNKAFISALDNAVTMNRMINKVYYVILINCGFMLVMCFL